MTAITFDTLKFANRLKAAGMESAQAEALAEAQSEAFEVNLKELATKEDLRREADLLRRDIHELEQRLTIRLGGMMTAAVAVTAALVKLL